MYLNFIDKLEFYSLWKIKRPLALPRVEDFRRFRHLDHYHQYQPLYSFRIQHHAYHDCGAYSDGEIFDLFCIHNTWLGMDVHFLLVFAVVDG